MGLENAGTIAELNEAWPLDTDPFREGAAHIRMLKAVLKGDTNIVPNKIVILGDTTAGVPVFGPGMGQVLEAELRDGGADAQVISVTKDGMTFFSALTASHANGQTAVQQVINLAPQVVFVILGGYDCFYPVRTLEQIQADAAGVFAELRAGLPDAKLIFGAQILYDKANVSPSGSVYNRHVIPALMTLATSGALANSRAKETLNLSLSSTTKTQLQNWRAVADAISVLPECDGTVDLDLFKVARLGLTQNGFVPTLAGYHLLTSQLYKYCRTTIALHDVIPSLAQLRATTVAGYESLDDLWGTGYAALGSAWTVTNQHGLLSQVLRHYGVNWYVNESSWYRTLRATVNLGAAPYSLSGSNGVPFVFAVGEGFPPNTSIYVKAWPVSKSEPTGWSTQLVGTTHEGGTVAGGLMLSQMSVSAGNTYNLKVSVIVDGVRDVFGPQTIYVNT